ncbi:MAG: peptide chain release factor N(5)-glutamine methyltransferase [Gemmatimonadota bacterium]
MVEAPVRLGQLLRDAAGRLRSAGVEEAAREARLLWATASHSDAAAWQPTESSVDVELQAAMESLLERRLAGAPLAHVTELAGFRRLLLRSDSRGLIPRPETEGLVELLLGRVSHGTVADLGTGSGCIALSLADEGNFDQVIGVDRSVEALALARHNRKLTRLPVELVAGDWLAPLRGQRFDALVSNPPYLTEAEYQGLERGVREHEPRGALASGEDGLADTRQLLRDGQMNLTPRGWLAMELDCRRAAASAELAREYGWMSVSVQDDLFGRARYLLAQRSETA